MSGLVCAMSGETPTDPVVSVKSGNLFEKSLVTKYVQQSGTCPVTGEPLSLDDLVSVKGSSMTKPRTTATTSLPGLFSAFQNEWDAVVLEAFELRKTLEQTRLELSHALYQHDAACRVIAKLMKERDQARSDLAAAAAAPAQAATGAASTGGDSMDVEGGEGITAGMIKKITEKSAMLSKGRKKREISASLASVEAVGAYKEVSSAPVHLSNAVTCIDAHHSNPSLVLTGGADNKVVLFDISAGKQAAKMEGHTKAINRVLLHPTEQMCYSASADKTVRAWSTDGTCKHTWKHHTANVTGLSLHVTGEFLVSASMDSTWAFMDLATGTCRKVVQGEGAGFSVTNFHPDGLILGTGKADGTVTIWEVQNQKNVITFSGHSGAISSIAFSENGYSLATCGREGANVWDLRKLAKNPGAAMAVKTFAGPASEAVFDYSGSYLAVANEADLNVYHAKTWADVLNIKGAHKATINGLSFGPDAQFIATAGKDKCVKVFGA